MALRSLFGPVTDEFIATALPDLRSAGDCRAFGPGTAADVRVAAGDTWGAVCARLPDGWRPDFVAAWLAYTTIPAWVWTAPVPVVGLAADWNLLWHPYRHCLSRCDLVLTDGPGVEALSRSGLAHVRPANLFGLGVDFLRDEGPEQTRDIDVAFVGNLHPAVQGGRLPWLARLARLSDRYTVVIRAGTFGAGYRALLRRAKVGFNRSVRGECNRRAFETAACGALLFQESGNREVPRYFADSVECVYYADDDLEALLEHYLDHDEERRLVADAGRTKARDCTFARLWRESVGGLENDWPAIADRARRRTTVSARAELLARSAARTCAAGPPGDSELAADLRAAVVAAPADASLHHALGLALAATASSPDGLGEAVGAFGRAAETDPAHAVAALSHAEALAATGRNTEAADSARRALAALGQGAGLSEGALVAVRFPTAFDAFRVAWERAGWSHAGDPAAEAAARVGLIRWRLHALLARLTGDVLHFHEASLAHPADPATRAALGCALARAGHNVEARPHLQTAVAANPFDRAAARALVRLLGDLGDEAGRKRLMLDCRRLAVAAPQAFPTEPWFADASAAAGELASVLVVCCDGLTYTRECVEAVLAHTRPPFELVVVDNGSTDATAAYLAALADRAGPGRVTVIRNDHNRGYPAAANQALAAARGEYVVFLNNDAVVAAGWLDGLLALTARTHRRVGLVGPVSNYAPPPQLVSAPQGAPAEWLAGFAADRRARFAGQALEVGRLSGFCLLARRAVLDKIGGLDERFGLGFFDDDDLCQRVRDAGYALAVAEDVFVHHYGSRTFAALGVDTGRLLSNNLQAFREKWGPDRAEGYRPLKLRPPVAPPTPAAMTSSVTVGLALPVPSGSRPRVSLCMIVRDEEANLPDCLTGLAGLFHEIVVADTGSADRTKAIAAGLGARVVDFPWCDDFAAARNASLDAAAGDWVMWLDADDRLDEANRARLRALFGRLDDGAAAYAMKCECTAGVAGAPATVVDHVRLFRRDPRVRWRYRVHEQILPAVRALGGEVRFTDVVVRHVGYTDPAVRRRKLDRDLRLLKLEDADRPDDPFTLFNLGAVYHELGDCAAALPLLRRSLGRSHPADSIVRKLYALIAGCHRRLGRPAEALAACADGRRHYPDDAELLFTEGLLHREAGASQAAEACWLRLLGRREGAHFASVDASLTGAKARHNLAVLYFDAGRHAEAEAQWRTALDDDPAYLPASVGLAELYLKHRRWVDLERLVQGLEGQAGGPAATEVAVLRARGHLARREFAAARAILADAIARHPTDVRPRVILSHVLLQEGTDWPAAEEALVAVLGLDPRHAEARRNLEVLRGRHMTTTGSK